jgi:hypothetical protein
MGKKRKEPSEQSVFTITPSLPRWIFRVDGFAQCWTLLDRMEDVQVGPKQRKFVWPDAGPLDLQQSIEHIQKQCPDFSVEEIEGHLLFWIESGYGPAAWVQRTAVNSSLSSMDKTGDGAAQIQQRVHLCRGLG